MKGTLGPTKNYATLTTDVSASTFAYAPHGGIQTMTLGNQIVESTTYNSRLQPTSIQAGSLLTLGYGYGESNGNDNGNMQSQTITRGAQSWAQSYGYDGVNRVCAAFEVTGTTPVGVSSSCTAQSTPVWAQSFGYDAAGNRWVDANPGPLALSNETPRSSAWFASNNQIVQTGWSYDNAGNVTGISTMSRTFVYDAENHQTSASINGTTPLYGYDGDGRRVLKTTNSGTTTYVYDAAGELAAEYPAVLLPMGGTKYLTVDSLGSTRLVTDESSKQIECEDYLPFGEQLTSAVVGRPDCFAVPDVVPEKKFTGKERDAETGLDYFGARYFSSAQGRWTSPDWSERPQAIPYADLTDPQTLNLYLYVGNNPLSRTDPSGHWMAWDHAQFTAQGYRLAGMKVDYRVVAAVRNVDAGGYDVYSGYLTHHGAFEDAQDSPEAQADHLLRTPTQTESEAYEAGIERFQQYADIANAALVTGDTKAFDSAMGGAGHFIQDSYAHTTREGGTGAITHIQCYTCTGSAKDHAHPDVQINDSFSPQANGAINATAAFLKLMNGARHMSSSQFQRALGSFVQQYLSKKLPKDNQDK